MAGIRRFSVAVQGRTENLGSASNGENGSACENSNGQNTQGCVEAGTIYQLAHAEESGQYAEVAGAEDE